MSLERTVLHSFHELLPTADYGPGDAVLLTDTGFLFGFPNFHLWAWQAFLEFTQVAKSVGKRIGLCTPLLVAEQYERNHNKRTLDEFGIPLALVPYDGVFGAGVHARLPDGSHMLEEAMAVWKGWKEKRVQFAAARGDRLLAEDIEKRRSAGIVDLGLIAQAIKIAETGAGVYVASSDFKDVINPLVNRFDEFRRKGLGITVLPPSDINPAYFSADFKLGGTVTGEVLKELQAATPSQHYTLVLFEKVRSGSAEFLAGVGVVQKRYFRPVELSSHLSSIPDARRELVPVLRVKSLEGLPEREEELLGKRIAGLARALNVRKVVLFQENNPYNVVLGDLSFLPARFMPASREKEYTARLFRADLEFLSRHTTSLFAANYRRNLKQSSVPIPK